MSEIILTEEQDEIVESAFNDLMKIVEGESVKEFVSISGNAGTGKTTILPFIAQKIYDVKLTIAFCVFTGKASGVLRAKLESNNMLPFDSSCSTIHSLIYRPIVGKDGKITGWSKTDEIDFDIIVIDEASMVSKELFKDLLSLNLPILVIGDNGQLRAIGDNISLVQHADYSLTKILRQAKDSPIISVSINAREDGNIKRGIYKSVKPEKYFSVTKTSYVFDPVSQNIIEIFSKKHALNDDSIVLCGMHKTRTRINSLVRRMHKFDSKLPVIGEKILCLKNDKLSMVFNGQIGYVKEILQETTSFIKIRVEMEDKKIKKLWMLKCVFGMAKYDALENILLLPEIKNEADSIGMDIKNINIFDFAYAITVHKSQGSEWENCLVFEEYNQYQTVEDKKTWLYTAITRAKSKLAIIEDF